MVKLEGMDKFVFDTGSAYTKFSRSDSNQPLSVIPTLVGRVIHEMRFIGKEYPSYYVGEEAYINRNLKGFVRLDLSQPVQRSLIQNMDDIERIYQHCFYNIANACPEESAVLVSQIESLDTNQTRKWPSITHKLC